MQSNNMIENLNESVNPSPNKGFISTIFKKIKLNQGISKRNFLACLIHYFMLSFIFVSVDSLQPMLLQQRFNIAKDQQIQSYKNSMVIGFDIAVKVLAAPLFGFLADKIGRKILNTYGIIIISLSFVLMPFCKQFYQYILARIFYAHGAIAISVIPLLADYIHNDSKGTCSAILVFMSSLGALTSAYTNFSILKNLDNDIKIYYQYIIAAGITLVIGLFYSVVCIKSGNQYYLTQKKQKRTFKKMIRIGTQSMKIPQISLGYLSAFLARGDSILLSLYLVLWTYSFHVGTGDYDAASTKASALSGITYTVIMLSCIVYGLLYQRKKSNKWMMIAMLSMTSVGVLFINAVQSASSYLLYFCLIILGLGMSGLLTSSLYLVNKYADPNHRGYITGLQTLIGIFGITIQTFIGSVLFETTGRNGPFNLFGTLCLIGIPITFYLYRNYKSNQNELVEQNEMDSTINKNTNPNNNLPSDVKETTAKEP